MLNFRMALRNGHEGHAPNREPIRTENLERQRRIYVFLRRLQAELGGVLLGMPEKASFYTTASSLK